MINILNEHIKCEFVIICDHASNYIPSTYKDLGLESEVLNSHIAYDIGAKEVAIELSNILQCPLVMSNFSRLLIDPNRGIDDPTLIMRISDGNIIEGNKNIYNFKKNKKRAERIKFFYDAYHKKINQIIDLRIKKKKYPAIISIHSFTPTWKKKIRNTEIGILWDNDRRLPSIFFQYFKNNNKELIVNDNEPYSGRLKNDTIYKHATMNGLSNILIEIRQDLITNKSEQRLFAELISKPLLLNKGNPILFDKIKYPSLAK